MEMRSFKGIDGEISLLGFGLMRLPLTSSDVKDIDYKTGFRMIDRALDAGVNYFDTAWVYHERTSECFAGDALSRHPREKYRLATKMPAWQLESASDLERIFGEQLKKCKTDYLDFYLLHNIGGDTYGLSIKYGVYEFLRKKKEAGYIRYLGFSVHDSPAHLERVVSNWEWDFAQIQLNYIDWEAIDSKRMYEILCDRNIPVIVMEPVRGGALANLNEEAAGILRRENPSASQASWAIRYAASLPGVMTVLSGMTTPEQLEDNLKTMTDFRPLSEDERAVLAKAAASYSASGAIPCTACRYCMDCPSGVDIPRVFSIYNLYRSSLVSNQAMAGIVLRNAYRTLAEGEKASNCVSCDTCVSHCPQAIEIPRFMKEIAELAAAL
ncbi:MAG: aldo/keto reductase [Synergistaceae bacterium]|nr:aldo/keto reductase [Synergistaceae bacterium]